MATLIILKITILIISIIFHEVAHGYVAYRFGDPTAKNLGRLTLNPIPHIDILGSIILPALFILSGSGFILGWAKPVPVEPAFFRNPLKDMMWVALAGPLTNITLAITASAILRTIFLSAPPGFINPNSLLLWALQYTIMINIVLALFNMLPIPPLDGSKVLLPFLPSQAQYQFLKLEPFGFLIVFALAYFGVLWPILAVLTTPFFHVLFPPGISGF